MKKFGQIQTTSADLTLGSWPSKDLIAAFGDNKSCFKPQMAKLGTHIAGNKQCQNFWIGYYYE